MQGINNMQKVLSSYKQCYLDCYNNSFFSDAIYKNLELFATTSDWLYTNVESFRDGSYL